MTKEIPIGAVLQINATHRLTYMGDGKAKMERVWEERSATGGKVIDREPAMTWHADDDLKALDARQIAFWQSKI